MSKNNNNLIKKNYKIQHPLVLGIERKPKKLAKCKIVKKISDVRIIRIWLQKLLCLLLRYCSHNKAMLEHVAYDVHSVDDPESHPNKKNSKMNQTSHSLSRESIRSN